MRSLRALLLACLAAAVCRAAAPVTVTESNGQYVLSNGVVTAKINQRNGDLEQLIYKGIDTMGHDQGRAGYWEQDPSAAAKVGGLSHRITLDPAANDGDRAEISIRGITQGNPSAGLTPGSPGAPRGGTVNCDLEIRYALGRGDSGVYVYAIFSHPAAYGPLNVPESRYITKLNQTFDWISVDQDRNMLECAPTDWGTGVVVHAKEQRILDKGVYKNSVEHKYSYTAVQYKIPAFGWSSTKDHIGVWFINPTIEYLSGGATKQELVCHYGDNGNPDPIILDYWRGTHFNGGAPAYIAAGEAWNKVVGPIFVYCNSLARWETPTPAALHTLKATEGNPTVPDAWTHNATELWHDALAQAKKEAAQWPYDWVQGVDYPHRAERATVTGRLVLDDAQAATAALPHLTVGLAFPDAPPRAFTPPPRPSSGADGRASGFGGSRRFGGRFNFIRPPQDWAHDSKHYQFWADGSDDGAFTIRNVRPGTYTLHAFADGVLGEFARTNITVTAGQSLDLGKLDWRPVRYGRQVWDIGYPDRTGDKFLKGDGPNYWLWGWCLRYPLLFPHDLTYTVGQSDYHKDWFFEEVPHGLSTAYLNPAAKDPANQRFGWVKAGAQGPDGGQGPWQIYGRGRATTWTIRFNLDHAPRGTAALRVALAGADTPELTIGANGSALGALHPAITNALRYNTNKSVWQQLTLKFDAAKLKPGENTLTLTVPAGDLTSGVVYDYLRLELDESGSPGGT